MPVLLRHAGQRLATTLLVLAGAVALLFLLTLFISGNPAQVLLGPRATPEAVQAFAQAMGLDRPVHERFALFVWKVLRGDLGTDVVSGRRVATLVAEVLPYTVTLTLSAIGIAVLFGVPLGCYAATHPGSAVDRMAAAVSIGFIAIPNFVVAILLLMVFSIWLDWFPVLGVSRSGEVGDQLARLVLPAVSLAAVRRGAQPAQSAFRLRLPSALSAGRRPLPRRGTGRAHLDGRAPRRLPQAPSSRSDGSVNGDPAMADISISYLNGPDVERLVLTDDEILTAVEQALHAQGSGQTVIEPRVHLIPESSARRSASPDQWVKGWGG